MDRHVRKGALAVTTAAALLVAQPAQAAMGCWDQQPAAAAKVRDLQSRLMVAALRCKAMGYDVLAAYNDFIRRNRDALQTENGIIRAQFATGYGKDADLYYDRFTTSLANHYGGDATSGEICAETADALQQAAAAAGDLGRLIAIADRFGPAPELPGGACTIAAPIVPAVAPAAPAAAPSAPGKTFGAAMSDALAAVSDAPADGDAPPPRADAQPSDGDSRPPAYQPN
jgi:hypothetical protein